MSLYVPVPFKEDMTNEGLAHVEKAVREYLEAYDTTLNEASKAHLWNLANAIYCHFQHVLAAKRAAAVRDPLLY